MKDKSINRNGIRLAQAATGMSPADFPLGSMQSRAAARAIVDHSKRSKPRISQYDQDALTIVSGVSLFLCGLELESVSREVRATAIYKRGTQLELEASDSSEPTQWDGDGTDRLAEILQSGLQRSGVDVEFRPKDVKWHKPLVWLLVQRALLNDFEEAWKRQLPEMPFPVRVESDDDRYTFRLYYRQSSGQWKEETESPLILGPALELKQLMEEQANG
jgi:hypothetical protein